VAVYDISGVEDFGIATRISLLVVSSIMELHAHICTNRILSANRI
jgi:hypothetical protein